MKRRRLVALVSAAVFLTLGIVAVAALLFLTRTDSGRAKLLGIGRAYIASKVHGGSIYIGRMSGDLLTNVTFDSIAIRDKRGDLLVSTGRISLAYNPRDLFDNRIYVSRLDVNHPYVRLARHESGVWNFQEIFASDSKTPPKPKDPKARNLGDYIVVDSTTVRSGAFYLILPWHPDERGAARDSVIKAHLNNPAKAVAKTFDGYGRTYAWTKVNGLISHARLADPDSDRKAGQEFRIASLSADEFEPTFKFRNVRGDVQKLGDSVKFRIPHFDMPASTGNAHGKVWWGSNIHYDIAIRGDSVSLDDVNWVYPTLPRTGGGTLDLFIANDPKNVDIVDFRLSKMDIRSTKSHVTGNMTFGTGAPLLLVQNVDLRADPVDFDLLRTLAGGPFNQDWQGRLVGTAKGRGGPLTHFMVDDARGVFYDAHVPGAVSRFAGRGELDILQPKFTAFHHFNVDVASLDLRTIEKLFPSFPLLGGFVSGTATLDSTWLDVRFSNAHLVHQDGPGDPSRVSGFGRVTYGEPFMSYDLTLDAQPLSLTMLSRTLPWIPIRGLMSGPLRVKGSPPDLEVTATLQGAAGTLSFDGRVDVDTAGGTGARGRGQFSTLDLRALFAQPSIPEGTISGHYDVDLAGETAATLHGAADAEIERTFIDSIRVYPSRARVRFADGRAMIDSLNVHTSAFTLTANGGIGLPKGQPDSLHFTIGMDSLGGFRRYISPSDTAAQPDSLSGSATVTGVAGGTLDLLNVRGRLTASNLYFNKQSAEAVTGAFDVRDVFGAFSGSAELRADSVTLVGVALDTIGGLARFDSLARGRFVLGAQSRNGPGASGGGDWTYAPGTTSIKLDSLALTVGADDWRLARSVRYVKDSVGMRLDSLVLRNHDSGIVVLSGNVPDTGAVTGELRASRIPLGEFAALAQFGDSVAGVAEVTATVAGTKTNPRIAANAALTSIKVYNVGIDSIVGDATYQDRRFAANAKLVRGNETSLTFQSSVPVDVTLFSARRLTDSLSARLRADSTDLSLVGTLLGGIVDSVAGRLFADVRASGTWNAPAYDGYLAVRNGAAIVKPLGVKIVGINGRFSSAANSATDSIDFRAANNGVPGDTLHVLGTIKLPGQTKASPAFDLKLFANQFHALNKRSLADLYLSTVDPLHLYGTLQVPVLEGSLRVDRGAIYLADRDLARKLAVEEVADSTASTIGTTPSMLSSSLSTLISNLAIRNVTIALGDNVRLRSSEANVRLVGDVQLVTNTARSTRQLASGALVPRLELQGQFRTVDGTYLLDLVAIRREFNVLPEGTVTFDGAPETPTLDIKAVYNVPQYRDRDLGVIVNLRGRVPNYTLDFSSTPDYGYSQSDLLSYVLIGRPGLELGGANNSGVSQALAVLAPTLSAVAAAGLRQNLGSWFDMLQFQLGSADTQGSGSVSQILSGSTIAAGGRLGGNLYFNVNTGLCQFTQNNSSFTAFGSLGAKVEYRFRPDLSAQVAYDPATANRICSREAQLLNGFQPTPGQFSFSLSHTWRF